MKLSIIIPVYKVENHFAKCVDLGKYLVQFLGVNTSSHLFRFIHESKFKLAIKK